MMGFLQRVFGKSAAASIPYEESKRLSQSGAVADRRRVAANTALRPELLYFLAQDGNPRVRAAVRRTRRRRSRPISCSPATATTRCASASPQDRAARPGLDGARAGPPAPHDLRGHRDPCARPRHDPAEAALARARQLQAAGKLDNAAGAGAIRSERGFAKAALAVLAKLPIDAVDKVLAAHSAKGVVALAWQAGLSMRAAVALQTGLAYRTLRRRPAACRHRLSADAGGDALAARFSRRHDRGSSGG
jgi:hypothetical protein